MRFSDLFAAIARLFSGSPAVTPPTSGATVPLSVSPNNGATAASALGMPPSTQPAAPAQPAGAPVAASATPPKWIELCRPLVQHFESCYLTAYPDPASPLGKALQARGLWQKVLAGVPIPADLVLRALSGAPWTCGWGTTGADVCEGVEWVQATADARLDEGLVAAGAAVDRAATVPLRPQQKAALASIVYNVGAGRAASGKDAGRDGIIVLASGQPSTLLRKLNMGDSAGAADQFTAWNKSGGAVTPGLVRRRAAERDLFLKGAWQA